MFLFIALHCSTDDDDAVEQIINNMHLLRDDEDGRDLLELLQQRAGMLKIHQPRKPDTDSMS